MKVEPTQQSHPHDGGATPDPDEVFNADLAKEAIRRTEKLNDTTIDLAIRLKEAREFMGWSTSHIRTKWIEWVDESNTICREMNAFRMAFERETKSIISSGKDAQEFFNSPEYLKSHATLTEMVGLLERFSVLKTNGTMDAFADFILKIKCS